MVNNACYPNNTLWLDSDLFFARNYFKFATEHYNVTRTHSHARMYSLYVHRIKFADGGCVQRLHGIMFSILHFNGFVFVVVYCETRLSYLEC